MRVAEARLRFLGGFRVGYRLEDREIGLAATAKVVDARNAVLRARENAIDLTRPQLLTDAGAQFGRGPRGVAAAAGQHAAEDKDRERDAHVRRSCSGFSRSRSPEVPSSAASAAHAYVLGEEVGADDERRGEQLAATPSTVGKSASQSPSQPGNDDAERVRRQPAGELQLLHALADHHEQHEPKQDAGRTSIRL